MFNYKLKIVFILSKVRFPTLTISPFSSLVPNGDILRSVSFIFRKYRCTIDTSIQGILFF